MFYVYILKSKKDNQLYIGYTNDLRRRIKEHEVGENQSTKSRRPLKLVYYEAYRSKDDARKRENMLKLRTEALKGLKRRIRGSIEGILTTHE